MPSILFLCTANQIRSPFAAAYFQKLLAEHTTHNAGWTIESAGTWATPNLSADPVLQNLAHHWQLNFKDHKTKQVNKQLLSTFDLVLVMEKGQKEALHYEFPPFADKVYMLTEICTAPYDFPDPQGMDSVHTRRFLNEIAKFLDAHFTQICQKAADMH